MARNDGYPGGGKISITASLPSGTSCVIALAPGSRVEQLQPTIERTLKVPICVQRILSGIGDTATEVFGHEFLHEAGLENGACVTVTRSWPVNEDSILASLESLSNSKGHHNELVAVAIAELLERDSAQIQIAAVRALSWMGSTGAGQADKIARLLQPSGVRDAPMTSRSAAVEALSWMEAAGAAFASAMAAFVSLPNQSSCEQTYNAIRDFCWSEDWATRQAAMDSFVKMPVSNRFVSSRITPLMEEACFDAHKLVRMSAANALASLVHAVDVSTLSWQDDTASAELLLDKLCTFGSKVLESKSCLISAVEVQEVCAPLIQAITLASHGDIASLKAETKSVKKETCQVRVATVRLLGRLCSPEALAREAYACANAWLSMVCTLGVQNKSSQVRQASVEWLTAIHPHGACAAMNIAKLLKSDRKQKVTAAVNSYYEAYADSVEISSTGAVNTGVPQVSDGDEYDPSLYPFEYS